MRSRQILTSKLHTRLALAPAAAAAFLTLAGALAAPADAHAAPSASTKLRPAAHRAGSAWVWARSSAWSPARSVTAVDARVVERQARAALSSVGVPAGALVVEDDARYGDGDHIVRFAQLWRGLPVIGRGAAVRLDARGEPVLVAANVASVMPATASPTLTAGAAAIASAPYSPAAVTERDAKLVVWSPPHGDARLAWVVLPTIPAGVPTAPRIVLDAQTGDVIEARDTVVFAKARVYNFNPVSTPTLTDAELPQTPNGQTLTSDFITSNNCIDNKTVKSVNFFGFPMNLHVCDLVQTATADQAGDFIYEPADQAGSPEAKKDSFSEVSIYFHTARAYEYFRALGGDASAQVVKDKPLRVVANLQIPAGLASGDLSAAADPNKPLDTFSNAFFSPANGGLGQIFQQLYGIKEGGLWFGQGPNRDYAYDGDVVYHEFGHAIVDRTLGLGAWHLDKFGAIDAPGAMNEGLADYFAAAITGDSAVGEYASKDISQNLGAIRDLDNQDKCPSALVGEVHFDSTLFSGAMWAARKSLPEADRAKMDAGVYKAMRMNPGQLDVGYDDVAKLFLTTLDFDAPAAGAALRKEMTARGVLPGCDRVFVYDGKPLKAPVAGAGGYAAPGLQDLGLAGVAPGILQIKLDVDGAKSGKVNVSFKARAGGGGGGNPLGGQGTPFAPAVAFKFDAPISWTFVGGAKNDAASVVDAPASTASLEIPQTAKSVYVQIVNKGDNGSAIDDITVTVEPRADVPVTPPGDDPGAGTTTQTREVDNGCGCSTPGTRASSWAGVGALALAAGAAARRRRRR
ncbi:MAG: M36 family metallopeptidase [Myxococcales bacterium]|nr:M36 family metallopeptidase [Myxococcales bacterium]